MRNILFPAPVAHLLLVALSTCSAPAAEGPPAQEEPPEEMVLTDENASFFVARKAFLERYYDVAAKALSSFVETFPASQNGCEAYLMLGQSYFHLKKYNQAAAALAGAAAAEGAGTFSWGISFWKAKCDLAQGLAQSALAAFAALAREPSAAEYRVHSLYNISLCYEAMGQCEKALEQLQEVRKADAQQLLALPCAVHEARCLMDLKRSAEAKKLLLDCIQKAPQDPGVDEAFFLLGEIAISVHDYESSLKYYQRAVQGDKPEEWHPQAYYGIAWCNLELKKYDEALKIFQGIRELQPAPELLKKVDLSLCRLRLLRQENELAIQSLRQYVDRYSPDPTTSEAKCLLARAYLNTKQYKTALQLYDSVISASPDAPFLGTAYFGKGEALYGLENYRDSAQAFRTASQLSSSVELQFEAAKRAAEACYGAGDYAGAVTAYREALEKTPASQGGEILFRLGWSYYKKGDYDSAIASFQTLVTKFPQSEYADNALYREGGAYCRKGEYDKAVARYQSLEKLYPGSDIMDRVKYQMGVANYNAGKYYPAIVAFQQVVDKFPKSLMCERCSYEVGSCLYQLGEEEEALKHFRAHIARYGPSELSGEALFWIAEYQYNRGDYNSALESFRGLSDNYPSHRLADRALYWTGRCALNTGKYKEAVAAFSQLAEKFPKSDLALDSLYQLGCAYKGQRLFAEATVAFQKVNELYPKSYLDDQLTWQIAECLLAMGRRAEALAAYTGLLRSKNPADRARGRYGRGKCFQDAGRYSAAIAELMDVIWEFPDEKELVSLAAFAAAACYEAIGRRRDAIRVYCLIVDGDLEGKEEAQKAIESLRKKSLLFLLE